MANTEVDLRIKQDTVTNWLLILFGVMNFHLGLGMWCVCHTKEEEAVGSWLSSKMQCESDMGQPPLSLSPSVEVAWPWVREGGCAGACVGCVPFSTGPELPFQELMFSHH